MVRLHEPAVVTLDLGLPPDPDGTSEGFATLTEILQLKPDTKVIVASGHGARESALKAIALGAYDFYRKPVDIDELGLIVSRAFHVHEIEAENRRLEAAGRRRRPRSAAMHHRRARNDQGRRAPSSGSPPPTSRSCCSARAAPARNCSPARSTKSQPRAKGEFVAINCAAIPENLLEAELFGYEHGAFTGAVKTTEGKIELAQGGTLFLDEVGDIPLPLQVKLLRFLQERVIERIGGRSADRGRHADRLRDPPGSRRDDRRRPLPRGSLLSPRRDRREDPDASPSAPATRCCSPAISSPASRAR